MSEISRQNDRDGEWYQDVVAKHLEKLTNLNAEIHYNNEGIDVVCGEYKIEVKGTRSLFQQIKTKKKHRKYHTIRGWKSNRNCLKYPELTHFAFVLNETDLSSKPLIYFVTLDDIMRRYNKFPNSHWVHFPLWWIFDNYVGSLSRLQK